MTVVLVQLLLAPSYSNMAASPVEIGAVRWAKWWRWAVAGLLMSRRGHSRGVALAALSNCQKASVQWCNRRTRSNVVVRLCCRSRSHWQSRRAEVLCPKTLRGQLPGAARERAKFLSILAPLALTSRTPQLQLLHEASEDLSTASDRSRWRAAGPRIW